MSTFRAIAGVSSSIRNLLRDRMEDQVAVTIAPPDVSVTGMTARRLNLYLYQVGENGFLANQEIPGRGSPGAYGHPPLSLELSYLLTSHPQDESNIDGDLHAQRILGDAMRVLHDFPMVTEDLVFTRASAGTPGDPLLDPSLQGEFERLKVRLRPTSLEEFSKIWTALPKANFRCSVAYDVSVVQIESGRRRSTPLPVKTRRIHVAVDGRPRIDAVYRTPAAGEISGDARAGVGEQLTIEGANFLASKTWVKVGGLDPIRRLPASDELLRIDLPDDQYPVDADHPSVRPIPTEDRLQPGPQTVQVLVERGGDVIEGGLDQGTAVDETVIQRSNQSVFMLVPAISSTSPASGGAGDLLTVNGTRLWREGLKTYVVVGEVSIEVRPPKATDPWVPPTPSSVQVPLTALATATPAMTPGTTYLVRVIVNGAQSPQDNQGLQLT